MEPEKADNQSTFQESNCGGAPPAFCQYQRFAKKGSMCFENLTACVGLEGWPG